MEQKQNRKGGTTMQRQILQSVLVAILMVGLLGCDTISGLAGKKEAASQVVSLSDLPAPARATVDKLTAGGKIKKLEKEEKDGKAIYDVEAKVKDKDVEYDVASDGKVLTAEESIPYASLPAVVQSAAKKYFGFTEGLIASKEVENSKTFYEVEGKKGSSTITLKLEETGKIIEEEKGTE
jgi:uncharacterized membrane protein YkoI